MTAIRKTFTHSRLPHFLPAFFTALVLLQGATPPALAADVTLTPLNPTGIYQLGDHIGWTAARTADASPASGKYTYQIKKNNLDVIISGQIDLTPGPATIEAKINEPAMLYLTVTPAGAIAALQSNVVAGAAVAPTQLQPSAPRPADFDDFWDSKIKLLKTIPENPSLTTGDSGNPSVDYAILKMDHINGTHVYGQIAKPNKPGKFPALVIFQWASPPYPLQKSWVTGHAAAGWLTLNVEPHDVLPDQPKSYYDALPQAIKNYQSIGNDDRDKSYFLQMYLAGYRAVDYIASRPDWDGKTLVVIGTSMGGQQSLAVAGLNPKVTHVIVNEPAGCDTNGPLYGRQSGYPNFPANNPKIMETALYFDAVNFAPHITATSLVAMGFVDTTAPPAGIWTAFNQIKGPKEAVPMIDSPHNHLATPAQQRPYNERSALWLDTLVKDADVKPIMADASPPPVQQPFDDYQNMKDQLGVKAVRRGPSGSDPTIYDESTANRYKDTMPDVLKLNDGTKVTSPDQWPKRRAEIVEEFEREVYGRIPPNVPKVTWEVTATTPGESGGIPTVTKTLVGHVANSAYPQLSVNIQASVTVPAGETVAVPAIIAFAGFGPPRRPLTRPAAAPTTRRAAPGIPWTQQAIAKGLAYGTISPTSIQPDNNQLTTGIIGLTNKGQPRTPEQWGALRAWAWGVGQLVDYFQANPDSKVDPAKVGIEGLSRYGKAALVTEAFDPRIAVGLIGSSGEGGAKLHRHIFGESVESLAGGEYYWMAGNFIKYGASDPQKTVADLPVDSHELIALCAPRPCFISQGVPEHGDAKWIDAHGAFMAGVLASPVYELLGKKGLGTPGDYLTDPMPPVGQLIGGDLAWRQHDGGHDVTPNWPAFFDWVGHYIKAPPLATTQPAGVAADQPVPRTDASSRLAHEQLLAKARAGGIDLYFLGDSITRRWGCADPQYADLLGNWKSNFFGWNAGDFGWGGDQVQNILWRVENGELDGVHPKVIVFLAGTNNIGTHPPDDTKAAQITRGLKALIAACQIKAPNATLILTAIFPRNDNPSALPTINQINANLAQLADGTRIRYLNINSDLADPNGKLLSDMTLDGLHPTRKAYQIWANALRPILTEVLGPPAATDHAPPPTADPSAVPAHGSLSQR